MPVPNILATRDIWSTVPYALLTGRSPLQQAILLHVFHANATRAEDKQPSATQLAEMCGITLSTFHIAAGVLADEGILLCVKRGEEGGGNTNRYFVTIPEDDKDLQNHSRYRTSLCITRNYVTHNTKHSTLTLLNICSLKPNSPVQEELMGDAELGVDTVTSDWIVSTYQVLAEKMSLPSIRNVSPARARMIQKRIKDFPSRSIWQKMFDRLSESPHLSKESWFSFSFIIESSENFEKVMNGWMDWKKGTMTQPANKLPVDEDFHSRLKKKGESNGSV